MILWLLSEKNSHRVLCSEIVDGNIQPVEALGFSQLEMLGEESYS